MSNDNWMRKREMVQRATNHTEKMKFKFTSEIEDAIKNTRVYRGDLRHDSYEPAQIRHTILEQRSTTSAIMLYSKEGERTAALNFASYKEPGGCFMDGATAQEECLCHTSFLYNVLKEFGSTYYKANIKNLNKGLYTNAALYTPDVSFTMDEKKWSKADVITCAAPNITASKRSHWKEYMASDEENLKALRERCRFVLEIAYDKKVDNLILGAFGCGVFGQNPKQVCSIFLEENSKMNRPFSKLIFAIPYGENYEAFKQVLFSDS